MQSSAKYYAETVFTNGLEHVNLKKVANINVWK